MAVGTQEVQKREAIPALKSWDSVGGNYCGSVACQR